MPKYPTKKEIFAKKAIFGNEIKYAKEWKRYYYKDWNKKSKSLQIQNIIILLYHIAQEYKPFDWTLVPESQGYSYSPKKEKIFLSTKPSIISALHELGHHLHGASELQACRWSIQLFKEVFPQSYTKLHFEGHMLKQNAKV